MLYSSLKHNIFIVIFFLGSSLSFANQIQSTYKYVPKGIMPAASYHGQKQKNLYEKALSKKQKNGMKLGSSVATLIKSNIIESHTNKNWLEAAKLRKSQQHIIYKSFHNLGSSPNYKSSANPKLYYFISFSMPKVLIKEYMLDAIWNGGILVLRGVEKNMTLSQFIKKDLMPLVSYKGNHAKIEIDPNLFELYNIKRVPTFVVSKAPSSKLGCEAVMSWTAKKRIPYQRCKPLSSNMYWKLSGSVTSLWAINKLISAGAPGKIFIDRMKNLNAKSQKVAKGFSGNWRSAPMPFSNSTIAEVLHRYGKSQTKNGSIGAIGLINMLSKNQKVKE